MSNVVVNDNLVLICGEPIAGKTASLRYLENPEGVMYLNCESGKKPPFKDSFKKFIIVDPYQIHQAFQKAEEFPEIHTIVVDSLTFLMDMFFSVHINGSANTMAGWSDYAEFMRNTMQQYVAKSTKNVIFTAHVESVLNEQTMTQEKRVPVKGQLAKNGVEAFFSCIVTARKMTLSDLEPYKNSLLNITEDDEMLGFKHVYQTRLTKQTVGERGMRSPIDMWSKEETFIDNNAQFLLNRLREFYA